MISGSIDHGAVAHDLRSNTVLLSEVEFDQPQYLVLLHAFLDGLGSGGTDQALRGVIFDAAGNLVAAGDTVTVPQGQDPRWVGFDFNDTGDAGKVLPAGSYRFGLHAGTQDAGARVYRGDAEPSDGSRVYVQQATPAGPGPYLWFRTDVSGAVIGLYLEPDGPGGGAASNAQVFVQQTEPDHPGTYVWYELDEAGAFVGVNVGVGAGPATDAPARLFIGDDAPDSVEPYVWLRQGDDEVIVEFAGEPAATYPFADGAPAALLPGSSELSVPAFLLHTIDVIRVPTATEVDDDYFATLPFDVTQRIFRAASPIRGSAVAALAGWYGTTFDATTGAHAIARTDGPLAELVGERVLVTRRSAGIERSVAVYVHDEREFPEELETEALLLTPRTFFKLGNWALDSIDVTVEVLG